MITKLNIDAISDGSIPASKLQERYVLSTTPPNNEIWYTSTDGNIVTPYATNVFGANIVSNTYENGKGVIKFDGVINAIGNTAFWHCSQTSITIPDSVTSIGEDAFSYCTSLTSVIIPDSVTSIGRAAFMACTSLTSATIGNGVTSIGNSIFNDCHSMRSIYCKPTTPPTLYEDSFGSTSIRKIYVPIESVDAYKAASGWSVYSDDIVGCVFEDEALVSGENIKTIEGKSILGKGDIKLASNFPQDDEIWYTSSNYSVLSPTQSDQFGGCQIISNTYSNGIGIIKFDKPVTTIGEGAFDYNEYLTSVYIPEKVTNIGMNAFNHCPALTDVFMGSKIAPEIYDYYVFGFWSKMSLKIWIPHPHDPSYYNGDIWGYYVAGFRNYIKGGDCILPGVNIATINGNNILGSYDLKLVGKNSNGNISENLIPASSTTTKYDLGSSDKKWGNVYAENLHGLADCASAVEITGSRTVGRFPLVCVDSKPDSIDVNSPTSMSLHTAGSKGDGNSGIFCDPDGNSLVIGADFDGGSGDNHVIISPTKIFANNLTGGLSIETNGGDWSIGSSNTTCRIHGHGGCTDITGINGIKLLSDSQEGKIDIMTMGHIRLESFGSDIEVATSYNFEVTSQNIEINQGGCYAKAFYETSDENLKDFTDDITVDFNKLKEIRKSYFTWKDGDQNLHIGTSAQDIQKVYPELVSEDNNGNLTVDYAKLSIIALSAIDKLDERLSRIENILNKEE